MNNNKYILLGFILLALSGMAMKVRLTVPTDPKQRILTQRQMKAFSNVKMIIDGNGQYIYPQSNNIFSLPEIHGGVHIVEAISDQFLFPVLVIDKRVEGSPKMKWLNPLDRKMIKAVTEPTLSPIDKIKYFEPEAGSFLMGFLMGGNGLFILMGIMMIFCYKGLNKLNEAQMAPPAPQQ